MSWTRLCWSALGWFAWPLLGGLALADDRPGTGEGLPPPATIRVDYARDVRPIFAKHCYRCHGPQRQRAGLGLHVRDRAMAGGDEGPSIQVGKSHESRLIQRVAGLDEDER